MQTYIQICLCSCLCKFVSVVPVQAYRNSCAKLVRREWCNDECWHQIWSAQQARTLSLTKFILLVAGSQACVLRCIALARACTHARMYARRLTYQCIGASLLRVPSVWMCKHSKKLLCTMHDTAPNQMLVVVAGSSFVEYLR